MSKKLLVEHFPYGMPPGVDTWRSAPLRGSLLSAHQPYMQELRELVRKRTPEFDSLRRASSAIRKRQPTPFREHELMGPTQPPQLLRHPLGRIPHLHVIEARRIPLAVRLVRLLEIALSPQNNAKPSAVVRQCGSPAREGQRISVRVHVRTACTAMNARCSASPRKRISSFR